jgi:hypothetical protein
VRAHSAAAAGAGGGVHAARLAVGEQHAQTRRPVQTHSIRQHTLAYVSIRAAWVNPKARRCSPSLTLAMGMLTYADECRRVDALHL